MNTKILFIKFSRTDIKDYCWLFKSDTIEQEDYRILEKIFSEYKLRQVSKENSANCGLIELASYFYFFSCYKTKYTDNYGREIFALDALCIKKENFDMIYVLYYIFFSHPQKYIQCEQCLEGKDCPKSIHDYTVDVKNIFEDYLQLCKKIEKDIFPNANFYPSFRGFDNDLENRLLQIIGNKNIKNVSVNSCEGSNSLNRIKEKKCTLFVIEKKKFLFGKFSLFIIKGDFNCKHNIFYIEKIFSCSNDLHNYVDEIVKKLDEYKVNVEYNYLN